MIEICPQIECTGCMACAAICSHKAINKDTDRLGFIVPIISQNLCTDCGLCKKVCPSNFKPICFPSEKAYASVADNNNILAKSASGGIATLISQEFIKKGGVVYGCSGIDIQNIHHIRIEKIEDLYKIQDTKYVQSDISGIYQHVKEDLKNGINVLCIGLSCQIAGIRKFLMQDYENLFTIDIICHGGPSQKMINDDLNYIKRKFKIDNIINTKFRYKVIANQKLKVKYGLYITTDNKNIALEGSKDPFTYGYSNNLIFRDSCYQCQYTNLERVGDLTIGDFWKLGEDSGLNNQLGVSLVIPHTHKGEQFISLLTTDAITIQRTLEEAIKGNPQLVEPTKPNKDITKYRKIATKYGIVKASMSLKQKNLLKHRIHKLITLGGNLSLSK